MAGENFSITDDSGQVIGYGKMNDDGISFDATVTDDRYKAMIDSAPRDHYSIDDTYSTTNNKENH